MEDFVLAVSTPMELDLEVYYMWVSGKTEDEAYHAKMDLFRKAEVNYRLEFRGTREQYKFEQNEFVRHDVVDQYRAYEILVQFLSQPLSLKNQCLVVLKPEQYGFLIDQFWSVDDCFLKEILHKKLTRSRKDLEDAAESFHLNIRSLSRQYDNIKRIYNAYENPINAAEINIYSFVTKNFLLGPSMARKYSCFIFLLDSKFNLTSKKRLVSVECSKLEACSALTLAFLALDSTTFFSYLFAEEACDDNELSLLEDMNLCWSVVWKIFPEVAALDPDKQLLVNLRDMRSVLTGDLLDSGCNAVRSRVGNALYNKMESGSSNGKLRNIIKSLMLLGANLSQSREFRDLFEDVLTKVGEPLEDAGLSVDEIIKVVGCCYHVVSDIADQGTRGYALSSVLRTESSGTMFSASSAGGSGKIGRIELVKKDWLRFVTFVKLCLFQLL